jgi:hypothetical protein
MLKSLFTIMTVASLALVTSGSMASAKSGKHHNKVQKVKFYKAVPLPVIRKSLRRKGFSRIVYTDRRLPVYKAKACKNGKRFTIRLNRRGAIISRHRTGRCFG